MALGISISVVIILFLLFLFSQTARNIAKKFFKLFRIKKHKAEIEEQDPKLGEVKPYNSKEEIKQNDSSNDPINAGGSLDMFGYGSEEDFSSSFQNTVFSSKNQFNNSEDDLNDFLSSSDQQDYDQLEDFQDEKFSFDYDDVDDDILADVSVGKYSSPVSEYSDFDDIPIEIGKNSFNNIFSRENFENQTLYDMYNSLPKEMKVLMVSDILKKRNDML